MPHDDILNWRVEGACRQAWPAPRETVLDGWLLRASGGPTRRTNSANPLGRDAAVSDTLIDRVELFYAGVGQPAIFRVPAMANAIDPLLAARGYRLEAATRTLFADLAGAAGQTRDVSITPTPGADWLAARDRMSGSTVPVATAYRAIIDAIALPCAFASVRDGGKIVSLGFAVRQDDLLIFESVMTDAAFRQRGLARRCLSALLGWAVSQGCRSAALQVTADNEAALALYGRLGFNRDLYGYHYRVKR